MKLCSRCVCFYVVAAAMWLATTEVSAENWPGWRGPRGDGSSVETKVPVKWSKDQNIKWKTEIPGNGYSSPVVWKDRIFLTTCNIETLDRILMCLDRTTGEVLWQNNVVNAPLEKLHKFNSHASGTPVTDGNFVYVAFLEVDDRKEIPAENVGKPREMFPGQMVVSAYDFDGNQKWQVRSGDFNSVHGFCSCPILYQDSIIINGDHDGDSYIVALDKQTGDVKWKQPRRYKTRSYVTPIIREVAGKTQMVLTGSKCVTSYDPADGTEHWTVEGPTEQFVASMVFDGTSFYLAAGFPTYHVMSIKADGSGDVTNSHVLWHEKNAKCYVPSPVVVDHYLFVADDSGFGNCYETSTGKRIWKARMGNHYSASLVTANGLVYFLDDDGVTKVVKPGLEPEIVAENRLGEECRASLAISGGQLFIRGLQHLYCIEE